MPSPQTTIKTTTAIVRAAHDGVLKIRDVELPETPPTHVVVEVRAIGLCRTDFYAIEGKIPTKPGDLIPGHEFAGVVHCADPSQQANGLRVGDHVVVNPVVPCGECSDCQNSQQHCCAQTRFMGVDLEGACCEHVIVPASACHVVPKTMPFEVAAFSEPVAATTSILKADLKHEDHGLLIGDGRIAELAKRVLIADGFDQIQYSTLEQAEQLESDKFDFVIEAALSTKVLNEMVRLVRPRGKLILKSRQYEPVQWSARDVIGKEPNIRMVNYGRFEDAVSLLVENRVRVDDLVGQTFALEQFAEAFEHARMAEGKKTFLQPGGRR